MKNFRQELIRQKFWQIWELTQTDPEYAWMFEQMAVLEPRFERIMERLDNDDEDIIRDYVSLCEAMSQRMLECACEKLVFPENDSAGY